MAFGEHVTLHAETTLFADEVLYSRSTPYQRIVVTGNDNGFALWVNGALQFSSADDSRHRQSWCP